MNIGTLTVLLTANTVGLNRATIALRNMQRAGNSATAGIVGGMNATSAAAINLGRSLTQFLTLPMSLLGVASMKTFSEFEFNLAKIEGLVGVAEAQTKAWGQSIMDLSRVVGKGPVELSDALYFITSSGYDTIEAMEILETTAKAAAAGLGETRYVADVVTSAMNAYRGTALTASKATDILVATVREGKGEVDKMVASMGVALPVASKLGVSMDQVGAAMAAMTRTGTTVSTSAVQVRQMFNSLMKPAAQSRENIKKMGSSYEELRNILREKGLAEMLQKVMELTGGNSAQMAKLFPNIRALNGIIELTGDNFETFKGVLDEVTNSTGATEEAFRIAQKTLKQQLGVEMARFQVILIKTGNVLKEVLLPLIRGLINVLEWLGDMFGKLPTSLQTFLAMLGMIAAAIGPLILLFKGLAIAVGFVKTAFDFLKAATVSNPWGALIVGITTVISLMASWLTATRNQTDAQKKLNKEIRMKQMLETATDRQKTLSELGILNFSETAKGGVYEKMQYTKAAEQSALNALKSMSPNKVVAAQMVVVDEMIALRKKINNIKGGNASLAEEVQLPNLEGMLGMYERLNTVMSSYIKSDKEYRDSLANEEANIDDIVSSTMDYANALQLLALKEKTLGEFFDYEGELLDLQKTRLSELLAQNGKVSKSTDDLATSIKNLTINIGLRAETEDILQETLKNTLDIQEDLTTAIERQGEIAFGTGDIDSSTQAAMDYMEYVQYMKELEQKIAAFGKGGATKFELMDDKLRLLRKRLTEVMAEPFSENWMANVEQAAKKYDEYALSIEKAKMWQDALINTLGQLGTLIGNALGGAEVSFADFATAILSTAGTIVASLLAIAIASDAAKLGVILGLAAAAVAIPALIALIGSTKNKAANMADGGIVPAGFPNDTFAANLSSNEAVIPLDRLPQLMGMSVNGKKQEVVFVIEGRVMKGILQDANSVSKAY